MAKKSKSRAPAPRGWFSRLIRYGLIAAVIVLLGVGLAVANVWSSLPSYQQMKQSPNGQMIRVRAVDGTVIVAMGPVYGEWIKYRDIPDSMVNAMVSVEDRRFRKHPGVDPIGIARSVMVRLQEGRWKQGGSTITQQLARNIFLNNDKNFGRKAREIIYAMALEAEFSKDQILELYLNRVYFGGGAYGIDAASRKFFGHPAATLDLAESAIIAGLVKAPSSYSPTADAKAAIGRAGVVLGAMTDAGVLTPAEAARVKPESVKLAPEAKQNSVRYFTDWALPQLSQYIDETERPIDVWTTLDLRMQNAAVEAIRTSVPAGTQGALVSIDRDGAVRAMVGGTDYVTSNYNRATQAVRQPGSAFKLFVYLAALENGFTVNSKVKDAPVEIGGWSPKNSSGRFAGEMDLRTAFAYSVNTVAAQLGSEIGTSTIADMARRFGISTPLNTHPSMVLGTADVRLLDMTRAYAGVQAKGAAISPYGIVKVTTDQGELLYARKPDLSNMLIAPHVAGQMIDLLQTAVNTGTGKGASIGRPAAGKTGTTSSNKDGWFMGFSSGLTTGVWMGRDDARPVRDLQGGRAPAKAWAAFMRVAVSGRKVEAFDTAVTLPEWQLETDEEVYFGDPDTGMFVDDNGNPLPEEDAPTAPAPAPRLTPREENEAPQTIDELLEDQAPQ